MAIVDTDNMMSAPKGLTCASGIDVMTHALEAYAVRYNKDKLLVSKRGNNNGTFF